MAEVHGSPRNANPKSRKSTRVDMTAMVDVAFLLLTFFILTTTLAEPRALTVNKPVETPTKITCNNMVTLYLRADDVVVMSGCVPDFAVVDYSATGIRRTIMEALEANPKVTFSVKGTEAALYGNLVDILDELKITNAPRHALATMNELDVETLKGNGY